MAVVDSLHDLREDSSRIDFAEETAVDDSIEEFTTFADSKRKRKRRKGEERVLVVGESKQSLVTP